MMQNNIFPLEMRHLPQLATLEKLCFTEPWSIDAFIEDMENPLAQYFVMEENGAVVGYVGSRIVLDEIYITNVAVAPDCRRRGIAAKLISALLSDAMRRHCSQIMLEARASNTPAITLYTGLGFKPVGMRKNYYSQPTEDAILMTLTLPIANT